MTDTERLDAIQNATTGYGEGWIFRKSTTGRGLRLHEASIDDVNNERMNKSMRVFPNIRDAIDYYFENKGEN